MPGSARRSRPRRALPPAGPPKLPEQGPEVWLAQAINAETAQEKREHAFQGLQANQNAGGDPEFQCLLLRQLYLAEFEDGRYEEALALAEQMIELGELADVARQDAARACQALGESDAAIGHLRVAARICPPSRRPFHDWTLGTSLYFAGEWDGALTALSRAARWATTQKPLYEALVGLTTRAAGKGHVDLALLRRNLQASPAADGYGELVLGELSFHLGDLSTAEHHLQSFVERVARGRHVKAATLSQELAHARALLAQL